MKQIDHPEGQDLPFRLKTILGSIRPKRDDLWYLGLPTGYFSLVNFSLPKAAGENLDQAVRYAMMRHVAYDLGKAYWHYQVEERPESYLIQAVTSQKGHVQEFLETVAGSGIPVAGIFPSLALLAWLQKADGLYLNASAREIDLLIRHNDQEVYHSWQNIPAEHHPAQNLRQQVAFAAQVTPLPEVLYVLSFPLDQNELEQIFESVTIRTLDLKSAFYKIGALFKKFPYQINLISTSLQRRKQFFFYTQLTCLAFLVLAGLSYPAADYLGQRSALKQMDLKIEKLQAQALRLQDLREENKRIQTFFENVAQFVNNQADMSEVLKELTEILPQNTWLQKFHFDKERILIQGFSASATSVIEALEKSPLFSQAGFESSVTNRRGKEMFQIRAKWK